MLGAAGVEHIARALSSGKAPPSLTLILGGNDLGAEGAKVIAGALSSGKAPASLTLNLSNNMLGAEGAMSIAGALSSGKAPASLTLNLWNNMLGAEGAMSIAGALSSGKAPASLCVFMESGTHTTPATAPQHTPQPSAPASAGLVPNRALEELVAEWRERHGDDVEAAD